MLQVRTLDEALPDWGGGGLGVGVERLREKAVMLMALLQDTEVAVVLEPGCAVLPYMYVCMYECMYVGGGVARAWVCGHASQLVRRHGLCAG